MSATVQFGSTESLEYKEYLSKFNKHVEEMFVLVREAGPVTPSVTSDDPKALGAAAASGDLVIDTETVKATPVLDEEKQAALQKKYMEIERMSEVIYKDRSFPSSDKDRVWQNMWELRNEFRERGINVG